MNPLRVHWKVVDNNLVINIMIYFTPFLSNADFSKKYKLKTERVYEFDFMGECEYNDNSNV